MRPLRSVEIPADVPGRLYLHSMPGRYEPLDECWAELDRVGCSTVVCLAPTSEIRHKSPAYANALDTDSSPCKVLRFPIPDYQAPEDDDEFLKAVSDTAKAPATG
jgi:hypothetical protein